MIVSMVRSPRGNQGRLAPNSNPGKFERVNVAFSRARDLLIVVGARQSLERFKVSIDKLDGSQREGVPVYGRIIEDILGHNAVFPAKDILDAGPTPLRPVRT
ncbi:hypothetical protein MASR1M32_32160 [Rhodobacter sp.]